jgi:PAS domain-containing protein
MKMPALAVVGPDHRIIRSTETFRRRYEDAQTLCERSPEIDRVLTGRADVETVTLGDLSVEVEAVMDDTGHRQAMLTLPPLDPPPEAGPPISVLREAADESPAIVWVKDLEGRYLYANPRYARELDTSEERLRGNTDSDLPETETVDGPRLRYAEDGLKEPLQLEYTVPAIDRRPAMAAFRFPLRDDAGEPIATCGVAAPASEAQVARDEAVRLMQLERWNRLDPDDVRAEVLEEWHAQAAPPRDQVDEAEAEKARAEAPAEAAPKAKAAPPPVKRRAQPEPEPEPARELEAAREHEAAAEPEPAATSARAEQISRPSDPNPAPSPPATRAPAVPSLSETAELLQTNLQLARKWADRAEQLQAELHEAQVRIRQAESEAQQALAAAARAAEESDRWRSELEQSRGELERTEADLHAARSELEAVRGELGAARAQADALRGPSAVALRLSEDLGRAMAAERERGDELERTLARLRARLTDFETAVEPTIAAPSPAI